MGGTGTLNEARTSTRVFYFRGRLYLFQELDIASHIGTLIYELNMNEIREKLLLPSEHLGNILVFDQERHPIFTSESTDLPPLDWQDQEEFISYDTAGQQAQHLTSGYYIYQDSRGWSYLLPLDTTYLTIPLQQILSLYLPVFLLLILVGLLFSWYISRVIYRPIQHLLKLVAPAARNDGGGSEVDILETAYSTALEEQAQLHGIVSNIAPEILESMLKNLLIGKHLTQERVTEILHGISAPISVRGRFFVLACQMTLDGDREVNDTEINLYLLAIRNLAQSLSDSLCRIYDIRTDVLTVALVCCFPEEHSLTQLSQDCRRIQQSLRLHTEGMPFRLFCARGKFYSNLLDIRYSCREAMEQVRYQQYLYSTYSGAEPDLEGQAGETGLVMDQAMIKSRAKDIMDRVSENALLQAEALMERVLEEIGRQAADDAHYVRLLQMLRDELLDRVITYPLTQEDQQALSRRQSGNEPLSRQEAVESVRADARTMFQMAASYSRKSRYKYIEQAKQFVTDNYMDSNLSLNSVGDHVGISASYLSELWSEITNEKFSVYLAALRVEKAQQLLNSTKLTIKEIGFRCGFNSVQNFIRVFKKYAGVPPGQYREGHPPTG